MIFEYDYQEQQPQSIKAFVKSQGISKGLLASIKFNGGRILVNQKEENVLYTLNQGDVLTLLFPKEQAKEHIVDDPTPLDILFEDEHLLVVNKPKGVSSIPVRLHPTQTMVNRVSAYYHSQNYDNDVVHTVTRLDKDTTGVMLFAKHRFCHALLDKSLRNHHIKKTYLALVHLSNDLEEHGMIDRNIDRAQGSSIERCVVKEGGKRALTEYWKVYRTKHLQVLKLQLHTGRTHQIRVHCASMKAPLLGDDLYGGDVTHMDRQALHCYELSLIHPFTKEPLTFKAPLPNDMKTAICESI